MGWTCSQVKRGPLVQRLITGCSWKGAPMVPIRTKWTGWTRMWVMWEVSLPQEEDDGCGDAAPTVVRTVEVILFRFTPAHGEICWKEVSENSGPCERDCPLSWLAMLTAPQDGYAGPWRESVREYHRSKGTGVRLKAGQNVRLVNGWDAELVSLRPFRVRHEGQTYRTSRRQLSLAPSA